MSRVVEDSQAPLLYDALSIYDLTNQISAPIMFSITLIMIFIASISLVGKP
ncbi:MAG: hypothetical protein QW599_05490 [Nitrososphaerota archaeon]